jgi:hypothetical protein
MAPMRQGAVGSRLSGSVRTSWGGGGRRHAGRRAVVQAAEERPRDRRPKLVAGVEERGAHDLADVGVTHEVDAGSCATSGPGSISTDGTPARRRHSRSCSTCRRARWRIRFPRPTRPRSRPHRSSAGQAPPSSWSMAVACSARSSDPSGTTLASATTGSSRQGRPAHVDLAAVLVRPAGIVGSASVGEGCNDDRREGDNDRKGEDHIDRPADRPPPRSGPLRRASAAGKVCRGGGWAVRHVWARLVLIRRVPSPVLGLPPARWRAATMPALSRIHPPVGASLVHRRTPQLPAARPAESAWPSPGKESPTLAHRPLCGRHS